MQTISIKQLIKNPTNPRSIRKDKLEKLKASIASFQKMMEIRPIVVDENWVVLGGNQRLAAITALGLEEIPETWVKQVLDLDQDEKQEFIIKDNSSFGEWDWDMLANEWDEKLLSDWGLDIPELESVEEAEPKEQPDAYPKITLTFFSVENAEKLFAMLETEIKYNYPECNMDKSGF